MPTYTYRCPVCEHQLERLDKMSAPAPPCPECGATLERVITGGAGLVFKGSGFYITDYGKDGKGPRKDKDGAGGDGATSKSESGKTSKKPSGKEATKKPAAGGDS